MSTKHKNISTCPICLGNFYSTEFSMEVCELHQNWVITTCSVCGKRCFSDCVRYCTRCIGSDDCGRLSGAQHGYNRDHRASLRRNGIEGWG